MIRPERYYELAEKYKHLFNPNVNYKLLLKS